jgi:hypothetical protein
MRACTGLSRILESHKHAHARNHMHTHTHTHTDTRTRATRPLHETGRTAACIRGTTLPPTFNATTVPSSLSSTYVQPVAAPQARPRVCGVPLPGRWAGSLSPNPQLYFWGSASPLLPLPAWTRSVGSVCLRTCLHRVQYEGTGGGAGAHRRLRWHWRSKGWLVS